MRTTGRKQGAAKPIRWTALAGSLLKIGFALALLGLFLEATARLVLFGPAGIDPRHFGGKIDRLLNFDTHRRIGFEYKPNLDEAQILNQFRTNSWGMRDREVPLTKPPDTFRVAVIGSSFALPAGVEIEDAFHSVLEQRLSAELAPTRYEFLNFAVGLQLPSQFVAMIQHRALRFDPDLILVSASPLSVYLFRDAWDQPANLKNLDQLRRGFRSMFLAMASSRLAPEQGRKTQRGWDLPTEGSVVEKLAEIQKETGIPIVIVRLELDATPPTPVERGLALGARARGMHYVDTRRAFAGKDPRDYWITALDPHPNAEAHAIFADVIGDFLQREGLVRAGGRVELPQSPTFLLDSPDP